MTHCDKREANLRLEGYNKAIPNLIVNTDDFEEPHPQLTSTAFNNYCRSWELAGGEPTLQYDDDIILCNNFYDKVMEVINKRPNDVIQFFSMRKDDLKIGSRYINGSNFLMQQCYYLPAGYARGILSMQDEWLKLSHVQGTRCPSDSMMAFFFKKHRIQYWNHCPNLVDHIVGKSAIDTRRSSKRQSLTFEL